MIDVTRLPKAELHVHIEGTFEPELIFTIAERNGVALDYPNAEALAGAYRFTDLQSFLDLYYQGMRVLRTEADYADLTSAYLHRAHAAGVRHAEIFFDPQAHTDRGVALEVVLDGIDVARAEAERTYGLTTHLIACFLRDRSAESAMETLEQLLALPRAALVGVGLDSAERGNPPEKFEAVFARARASGLRAVAHAGEEGPPAYIVQALDLLGVARIDHGVRAMEDLQLVARLVRERMPLTVCPLSNVRLRVVPSLDVHPLRRMLAAGLTVTCNSDDPAYFGGYVDENFRASAAALGLTDDELVRLARNSFEAAFIEPAARRRHLDEIDAFAQKEIA